MYGLVVVAVVIWLIIRARRAAVPPPSSDAWRRRYEKVLRSARWRRLRAEMYDRQRGRCVWCGKPFGRRRRELHHLPGSYKRLGRERPCDVVLLHQVPCHNLADSQRRDIEEALRRRARRRTRRSVRSHR